MPLLTKARQQQSLQAKPICHNPQGAPARCTPPAYYKQPTFSVTYGSAAAEYPGADAAAVRQSRAFTATQAKHQPTPTPAIHYRCCRLPDDHQLLAQPAPTQKATHTQHKINNQVAAGCQTWVVRTAALGRPCTAELSTRDCATHAAIHLLLLLLLQPNH
jgi:hypothetical protein